MRVMDSTSNHENHNNAVNLKTTPRGFVTKLKSGVKEMFFPNDLFRHLKNEEKPLRRVLKGVQYFIPILEWLPNYTWSLFCSDFIAGLTITSLTIPQGINYAKLAYLPPIIGLYSSFVPAILYAIFGTSRHMAVGTVASSSILIYQTISKVAKPEDDPKLYLHLVFTTTLVAGAFQACLGILRLGTIVNFLSRSAITGFIGGSAIMLSLHQLQSIFGMKHVVSSKTDLITVLNNIWTYRHEIRLETTVLGLIIIIFLQFTRYVRNRNPNLQWPLSIGPITIVIIGGVSSCLFKGQQHGIQIVGHLDKGINPFSIKDFNFESKYLPSILKAGFITSIWSLAEGITVGRNFAEVDNSSYVENKEMIAFGLMNLCGSFTSCYLTTGPFSKTAMNYNAGCKTAMSNIVQAFLMAFTLQFLAPLFYYTPLFALSAITVSTMLGLINYTEAINLYKVDKFDFIICIAAFLGVIFGALDVGLMLSVGLGVLRALLYVARPTICTLGMLPDLGIYRDVKQYIASTFPGVMIVQLGSPIFFANYTYIRERIMSYVRSEQDSNGGIIEHIILDMSGVTSIDTTAIQGLLETNKIFEMNGMKMSIVNPRMDVLEKLIVSRFVDKIGKKSFFLTLDDAVKASNLLTL
ncbi:PREDICTED: probable sulfate transporter 3.5 isoform X1 [Lupinus angustifolius]|uniref:probable sulfate transporter 3.5 isoform X1 n=1 Tax=Lupinus angustifolius TaxID=3871 RepID=UPI00092E4698|nr:PREDICTED: probable sulfate transporter 3.5 isoform X1 [Lupinus angustifolius]